MDAFQRQVRATVIQTLRDTGEAPSAEAVGGLLGVDESRVSAPPPASLVSSGFPYVTAEGTVVGSIRVSGTEWPILRAGTISTLPTQTAVPSK